MDKQWILKEACDTAIKQLQDDLKLHPALIKILALRNITDYASAKNFFRPSLDHLHDPFLMKGMQQAVQRITDAKLHQEKIMVYGDYDVDGTTAVAVVYSFLSKYFSSDTNQLIFYVPHRYREGYGISFEGIDEAQAQGCSLIIALDCGIRAVEKAQYCKEKNIDLIICDHHLPGDILPDATAILNPKQGGCDYPYKELSGCGIGFKLITALSDIWQLNTDAAFEHLDLVATSIAADIVPMDGENRILAYFGLEKANTNPSMAIKSIKKIAALQRNLSIADLVFIIAPRINAAGRMDDARKAVALFVEIDEAKALEQAQALQSDNFDRKEADRLVTDEALGMLQSQPANAFSTVVFQPHWHKGVVGIVASRLIDHYYRPTIVLTESNGKITGSARSVKGFSIYEAIHECREYLDNYGGHNFAAGLTMPTQSLKAFREKFEQVVKDSIAESSRAPIIEIDAELPLQAITPAFFKILQQMEPYGPSNLRPVFISYGLIDKGYSKVVKEQHLKIHATQGKFSISGIAFGLADKFELIKDAKPFDMIYTIDENEWNGTVTLQAKVIDIRAAL